MEIQKVDKDTGEPAQNGDASLAGAQFTVKFYDKYLEKSEVSSATPTRTWVLETKEKTVNGKKEYRVAFNNTYKVSGDDFYTNLKGKIVIPYGTITIEETKAPEGYKLEDLTMVAKDSSGATTTNVTDNVFYSKVEPDKDLGTLYANFVVSDPVKKYGIQVWKSDAELDKSEAIGGKDHTLSEDGATLEGVQFSIINRSAASVRVDGKDYAVGEEIMKITTKWDDTLKKYVAETDESVLPYGTYGVQEIAISQGYLLTDGEEKTVVAHGEDGKMYTPEDQSDLNFKNKVIRAVTSSSRRLKTHSARSVQRSN